MDVFNDYAGVDKTAFLNYIAKQLSTDVKTLIATRDELATRQGALTAAADAVADRELAKQELEAAKAQANAILAAATAAASDAAIREENVAKREESLIQVSQQFDADSAAETKRLSDAALQLHAAQDDLAVEQEKLRIARETLARDQAILDARIKAFQDKVAAISV